MQTKIYLRPSSPDQNGQEKVQPPYIGRNLDHIHAHICPHLRSFSDNGTAIAFPAEANCCYHVQPVTPVKRGHQQAYCLNRRYQACPIYRSRTKVKLSPKRPRQPDARTLGFLAVSFLLLAILLFWLAAYL